LQFKATHVTTTQPTTLEGIEKYLGSGVIRGTGAVYARALVRAFGEAVFDLIEQEQALDRVTLPVHFAYHTVLSESPPRARSASVR
jgi:hypothetical protein